jgi:hypothetical protein
MDIEKVKHMDKARVLYELERLSQSKKTIAKVSSKVKEKKKPDYNIFEKPKSKKAEDFFSNEFLTELKDYIHDPEAKKSIRKMLKNKNADDSTSSDEED